MSENYKGSIELISGIKPKNNGEFPLVNAADIAVYKQEGSETKEYRLDAYLNSIGVSEDDKIEIIKAAVEGIKKDADFISLQSDVGSNKTNIQTNNINIATNTQDILDLKVQINQNYKIVVGNENPQNVYLYKTSTDINTDDIDKDVEIIGDDGVPVQNPKYNNVITSSIRVQGGGGSGDLQYKLYLSKVTPAQAITLYGGKANIQYQFSNNGKDREDKYTIPGGTVTAQWYINNRLVATEKNITVDQDIVQRTFNVGQYLKSGNDNIVKLYLTNDEGTTRNTTWIVNAVNMAVNSNFNETVTWKDDVKINYTALGSLEKTVVLELDGQQIYTKTDKTTSGTITINKELLSHGSHRLKLYSKAVLDNLNQFIGNLDNINLEDNSFKSNALSLGLIFAEEGNLTPIISVSYDTLKVMQYDTVNIPYVIYVPGKATDTKTNVEIYEGETLLRSAGIENNVQTSYPYRPLEYVENDNVKTLTFAIEGFEEGRENIVIEIEKFPHPIAPATDPALDFSPLGRSNSEQDYDKYYDKYYNPTQNIMTVSDNFDWINGGWTVDGNGEACFLVKSGTTMTLDYPMFKSTDIGFGFTDIGRNIKFTFKTDLNKQFDSQVLNCYAPLPDGNSYSQTKGVGLKVYSQHAYLSSDASTVDLVYTDENKLSLEFNITPQSLKEIYDKEAETPRKEISGEILGLIDADYSRVVVYQENEKFSQGGLYGVDKETGYKPLVFGSNECDVYIYGFKVYNRALNDNEIINNYIADISNVEDKIDTFIRNQIFNDRGLVDPDLLAKANPDLRVIQITIPSMPIDKNDVIATTVTQTYINGRPEDNWTLNNVKIRGQGTSSMAYGAAALNLDLNVKDSEGAEFTWSDFDSTTGEPVTKTAKKYAMTDMDIAENYFNIKVNVASSENANNAILADNYHQFQPYLRPVRQQYLVDSGEVDADGNAIKVDISNKIRDTMKFYPCAIFIHETSPSEAKYFKNENEMMFWACGDFGNSKKNKKALGMDEDNDYECIIELCNNDDDIVRFKNPDLSNVLWGTKAPKDGKVYSEALEFRFTNGDDDNIFTDETILLNRASAQRVFAWVESTNTETPTEEPLEDVLRRYYGYVETLLTDFYPDDAKTVKDIWESIYKVNTAGPITTTNQPQYTIYTKEKLIEKNLEDAKAAGYEKDTAEYRKWKFRQEFDQYFISDSATYHYIYTERYTMIDNRAKNVFMHTSDGILWDFVFNYDNDTALGIDNLGLLSYDFGVEDTDTLTGEDDDGKQLMAFNAADSVLWCNLRDIFADRLNDMFLNRESAESNAPLPNETTKERGAWSASRLIKRFNNYQRVKPERLIMADMRVKYLRPYLKKMDGYEISTHYNQTSEYLPRMLGTKKWQRYYFEKYQEKYMSSKYTGSIAATDRINYRIGSQESGTVTVLPYCPMYVNVAMGNGTFNFKQRWKKGDAPIEITFPAAGGNTECDIYTSSLISELEGLAFFKVTSFQAPSAEKIRKLSIGSQEEGYVNNNNFDNFALGSNRLLEYLDVSNMRKLTKLTGLTSCINLKELYTEGTALTTVEPAPGGRIEKLQLNNVANLYLKNLLYLTQINLSSYDSLINFAFENCPQIEPQDILEQTQYLSGMRVIGINWTQENNALLDASLLNRLVVIQGLNEKYENITQSVLTGEVAFLESIRQSEIDSFAVAWPDLELKYDEEKVIPQYTVNFWRDKNNIDESPIFSKLFDEGYQLSAQDDPSEMLIQQGLLYKDSTPQYDYEFKEWSPTFQGKEVYSNLDFYGTFDEIKRQYKVTWYNDQNGVPIYSKEVFYGDSISYDVETYGLPTKNTAATDNKYHLFKGWSDSTGYVTQDIKVYPLWDSSTANVTEETESLALTSAQINALSKVTINNQNKLNNYIEDGEQIKVQLGYMPDYNGIVLVGEDDAEYGKILEFDGKTTTETKYQLFDEDKSFTLAIDFAFKISDKQEDNTLMSCGGRGSRGLRLYSAFNINKHENPAIQFNGDSNGIANVGFSLPTSTESYREICVIRHKKGDPNLYVYSNDKFNKLNIDMKTLTSTATSTIDTKLYFGSYNGTEDFGFGTIYYAKLWFDNLDDEECKKICSWTYEDMIFEKIGTNYYYKPKTDSETIEQGSAAPTSFVAVNLLPNTIQYHSNTSFGGWKDSDLRTWLNQKVFAGLSIQWQQIIQPVVIKSLYGFNDNGGPGTNGIVDMSIDKIYIPAYAELYGNAGTVFKKEMSTGKLYATLGEENDRIKTKPSGGAGVWWTRTPSDTQSGRQYIVSKEGKISTYFTTTNPVATFNGVKTSSHNVLIGFSIGG